MGMPNAYAGGEGSVRFSGYRGYKANGMKNCRSKHRERARREAAMAAERRAREAEEMGLGNPEDRYRDYQNY